MSLEIKGKLSEILPVLKGSGKNGNEWKKQTFVIETLDDQYPKKIAIDVWGDKLSDLEKANIGDELTAKIDIESREYNGKYFTNVKAWSIDVSNSPPLPKEKEGDIF